MLGNSPRQVGKPLASRHKESSCPSLASPLRPPAPQAPLTANSF